MILLRFSFSSKRKGRGSRRDDSNSPAGRIERMSGEYTIVKHAITQLAVMIVAAILVTGCSKSSSRSLRDAPQITIKSDEQAFLTNTVDVLRAKYSENERSLQEGQAKLAKLRGMNMPYQDEQRELEQLETFQRTLAAKILADEMGGKIKSPSR